MPSKVLVVDDQDLIVASTRLVLESVGCEVIAALDGTEAIEKAKHGLPDLILLDVMMPGMDGCETLRRLREVPETAPIPIVIFTAIEHSKGREKTLDMGGVEYFRKPFEPDDLIDLVEKLVGVPAGVTGE